MYVRGRNVTPKCEKNHSRVIYHMLYSCMFISPSVLYISLSTSYFMCTHMLIFCISLSTSYYICTHIKEIYFYIFHYLMKYIKHISFYSILIFAFHYLLHIHYMHVHIYALTPQRRTAPGVSLKKKPPKKKNLNVEGRQV